MSGNQEPRKKKHCESLSHSLSLNCVICYDVLMDPLQCLKGHCFCKECIYKWIDEEKKDCPACRASLSSNNVLDHVSEVPSFMKEELAKVRLSCTVSKDCKVIGTVSEIREHEEICDYRRIKCVLCHDPGQKLFFPACEIKDHVLKEHNDVESWMELFASKYETDMNHLKKLKNTRVSQFRVVADAEGKFVFSFAGIRLQIRLTKERMEVSGIEMASDNDSQEVQLLVQLEITTDTNAKFVFQNKPFSSKLKDFYMTS